MFKNGRTNVHDEKRSSWPTICSEWWPCSKCLPENLCNTALHNFRTFMWWISTNFTHSSLWGYHNQFRLSQVLHNMGSENAHGCTQIAVNGFGFDIFRVIQQR
jgi:hypothetical protein